MIPLITDMSQSILLAISCTKITQLLVRSHFGETTGHCAPNDDPRL